MDEKLIYLNFDLKLFAPGATLEASIFFPILQEGRCERRFDKACISRYLRH